MSGGIGRQRLTLSWRGDEIAERIMQAAQASVDDITAKAAADAASNHWWQSRTGNLEGNIVNEPAKRVGGVITGKFGSTEGPGFYGWFLERKTPFLRPAADRNFPQLATQIRARLAGTHVGMTPRTWRSPWASVGTVNPAEQFAAQAGRMVSTFVSAAITVAKVIISFLP